MRNPRWLSQRSKPQPLLVKHTSVLLSPGVAVPVPGMWQKLCLFSLPIRILLGLLPGLLIFASLAARTGLATGGC